jgi:hypothetical protein
MRVLLTVLAGLLLSWLPAHAVEPVPEMFAFGARLEVAGQQAFYQVELPLEVYQSVSRPDLGDIRVFNAAGQVVPHALRHPENTPVRQAVAIGELLFFPLRGEAAILEGDLAVHVERNPQGTIVDVRAAGQKEPAAGEPVRAYLVDTGYRERPVAGLELVWAEGAADFLGEFRVETSNDLHSWQPLTTAVVARLSYQGHRLDRSRIELPRPNLRYLRISWPVHQPPAEVAGVIALAHQNYTTSQPPRRWFKVKTLPVAGQPQTYMATLDGFLPVDRIRIQLTESNSMAAARLSSRDSATGPKREHWRGLIYHLQVDGRAVIPPAITVGPTTDRFWSLTLDNSEAALRSPPQIEFGWQPARLVFLAQGEGPFLLAYGSSEIEPARFPLKKLLQKTATDAGLEGARAEPGPQFLLGGPSKLRSKSSLPWKTWLLWTVLVAGVLLIGGMSFRLYQQLHDQKIPRQD